MPKITQMLVYIIADKDADDEGVPSVHTRMGAMPLLGADEDRVRSLRPYAQELADVAGKPVRLVRFTQMEELEVLTPQESRGH